MEKMTTLELTDQQAKTFILLCKAQAWDIRRGSCTLHFDDRGIPQSIEVRSFTYPQATSSGFDEENVVQVVL